MIVNNTNHKSQIAMSYLAKTVLLSLYRAIESSDTIESLYDVLNGYAEMLSAIIGHESRISCSGSLESLTYLAQAIEFVPDDQTQACKAIALSQLEAVLTNN